MSFTTRFAVVIAALLLIAGAAYGVGYLYPQASAQENSAAPAAHRAPATGKPTSTPTSKPTEPKPAPEAGPALYQEGDSSGDVRELQARLRQVGLFARDVTGYYGEVTAAAVRKFQTAHDLPATGAVDRATWKTLRSLTVAPTEDELNNLVAVNTPGPLDPRCLQGRVICVDKTSRTLRWVVDGNVLKTMDARFGGPGLETGEGEFSVTIKSRDHTSSIYDNAPMPFALFFNGGEAVHFSPTFVADGYNGASHGCVNLRDYDGAAWLFDQVNVGDTVVVYWS